MPHYAPLLVRALIVVALVHWHTAAFAQLQSIPVLRDPAVSSVGYGEFDGQTPEQIWHTIDGLEFWAIPLTPPAGFYGSLDPSSPAALRSSAHTLLRNARVYRYTHASKPADANFTVDTWDIIALADEHPVEPGMVLDIYLNATFPRQLTGPPGGGFKYDREHSWPKSLGFPQDALTNPPYSDVHHLFAAYSSYNGSRSNKPYGDAPLTADARRMTVENLNRGGAHEAEQDSSNYSFADVWRTWLGRRGDVARALMYMDVRYEGSFAEGHSEPDLRLTDDLTQIVNVDAASDGGEAFMGLLEVLLKWHEDDPVDDLERRRNTVVYLFQGNRNPFVDHPELVAALFGGSPSPVVAIAPWINEFHYDNAGVDVGEFVEVAGRAGTDLTGWKVVGYNGSGGKVYHELALAGTIPDLENGFGVVAFDFPRMQNGAPDGLALVDAAGRVVELLGYEGAFTATDGPADGLEAVSIGPSETETTAAGTSLQRTGRGADRSAFTWEAPAATRGTVNRGQELR